MVSKRVRCLIKMAKKEHNIQVETGVFSISEKEKQALYGVDDTRYKIIIEKEKEIYNHSRKLAGEIEKMAMETQFSVNEINEFLVRFYSGYRNLNFKEINILKEIIEREIILL